MNQMKDGVAATPGFDVEFYAMYSVCAEACKNNAIRIVRKGSGKKPSNEFQIRNMVEYDV